MKRPYTQAFVGEFNNHLEVHNSHVEPIVFSILYPYTKSYVRFEKNEEGLFQPVPRRVARGSEVVLERLLFKPSFVGTDRRPLGREFYYAITEEDGKRQVAIRMPSFYHLNHVAAEIGMQQMVRPDTMNRDAVAQVSSIMNKVPSNVISLSDHRHGKQAS